MGKRKDAVGEHQGSTTATTDAAEGTTREGNLRREGCKAVRYELNTYHVKNSFAILSSS
jgi:hypothetical protein